MAGTETSDKDKAEGSPRSGEPSGGLLSGVGATTAGLTDEAIAAEATTEPSADGAEAGEQRPG